MSVASPGGDNHHYDDEIDDEEEDDDEDIHRHQCLQCDKNFPDYNQ